MFFLVLMHIILQTLLTLQLHTIQTIKPKPIPPMKPTQRPKIPDRHVLLLMQPLLGTPMQFLIALATVGLPILGAVVDGLSDFAVLAEDGVFVPFLEGLEYKVYLVFQDALGFVFYAVLVAVDV